ncbi:NAD(P)/FAD-dependent oxidoreductase [Streptomyces sp. NBC_00483]|uniref:NAD(P)/FAD-dependent oxidoreductase n=1 Tax=Streptomyces sp. NBC_00483 TaxID=2975756 RepID=UPI002E175C80
MSTADPVRSVTVVGGGLAGFTAARELRSRGFEGTLRIVDPQGLPYDRPPLSKSYLSGAAEAASLHLAPPEWYADNDVEVIEDSAAKIAVGSGSVMLASGSGLETDAVVLATGGRARRLPVPGGDLPGVVSLRDLADADTLREYLRPGVRLLIVGAGLIGAEVASTATKAGAQVTLVDPVPIPLVPAVGEELAEKLHGMHAAHGVETLRGVPQRIVADAGALLVDVERQGRLERVAADLVLTAIGIVPDTSLAGSAGLAVDAGIEIDAASRTSNPGVWAAGDGVRIRSADGTLRRCSEHWEAAVLSGTAAACSILGQETPERPPSWFWTDRYGVHVEAVGSMSAPGSTVLRQSERQLVAFRVDGDGALVGCAAIDGGKTLRAAKRLIVRGARIGLAELADPTVDLKKVGGK